jgi:2-polyprenyl-3-methyl-5-hydroxy-6-metoxy-1,4-benzoquinol methylase
VDFVGYADRNTRKYLMANAECTIVASQYLEPFGGVMVESLFSGTPIITSDWGAMSENNIHGVTGYRCRNMEQYVWALNNINKINPSVCREYAINNFALEAIAPKYEEFFQQILDVYQGQGWYQVNNIQDIYLPARYIPNHAPTISFDQIDSEELPQAERLASWIKDNLNPKTVLDIGCGPGTYTEQLQKLSISTQGLDPDPRTRHTNYSLLNPAYNRADVVMCLEVMEHIDPTYNDLALENLVDHIEPFGTLIFTAAQPGQGGTGHINCRPKQEWKTLLEQQGLTYSNEITQELKTYMQQGYHMGWFINNILVFKK